MGWDYTWASAGDDTTILCRTEQDVQDTYNIINWIKQNGFNWVNLTPVCCMKLQIALYEWSRRRRKFFRHRRGEFVSRLYWTTTCKQMQCAFIYIFNCTAQEECIWPYNRIISNSLARHSFPRISYSSLIKKERKKLSFDWFEYLWIINSSKMITVVAFSCIL